MSAERKLLAYKVVTVLVPFYEPQGMATCATVHCNLCRKGIHHRGGGGDHICLECAEKYGCTKSDPIMSWDELDKYRRKS